jgi:hypothetical protein
MQPLVDLVGNITHAYTSTVKIVVLGGILLGVIITAMFLLAAPALVEEVGARTESISDKAIEAAREEARAHAMAKDGWGYSDAAASSETDAADFEDDSDSGSGDDWGAPAE